MLPDRFWFTGPVPDGELAAFYRWADVYVSLSEHEGFCVPLLEAMAADVPVFAYARRRRARNAGRRRRAVRARRTSNSPRRLLGTARLRRRRARSGVIAGQRAAARSDFSEADQRRAAARGAGDRQLSLISSSIESSSSL